MLRDKKNRRDDLKEFLPETFEKLLSGYKVSTSKTKEQAWNEIFDSIDGINQAKVVPLASYILRIAASLLVVLGLAGSIYFFVYGDVEIAIPKGSQIVHFLPDSSEIIINADSRLEYNKNTWFLNRSVRLSGEALFKVKKGSRFQVETQNSITTVLGTVFNVYSRSGITEVSCIEGKVKVSSKNNSNAEILTKGNEVKTIGNTMEKTVHSGSYNQKDAWTQGDFYFTNAPINSVIDELERQFDVDIFFDGDTNRFYTGYFSNKNLNDALDLVCIPMDLQWESSNKVIILNDKNK